MRIHGGATRSCIGRWTHPTWPMMGIPIITPIGLQGSAQHQLHAAESLKPELTRAGTTVHPNLLGFGKGVWSSGKLWLRNEVMCPSPLCLSFHPARDE